MNEGKELDCVYGSEHQKTTLFCYKGWYVCSGTLRVHKTNDHIYTGVDIEELKGIDVFTMCNPILSLEQLRKVVDENE